jgi:uncharacterized protein YjbI with pentapeptide repeats
MTAGTTLESGKPMNAVKLGKSSHFDDAKLCSANLQGINLTNAHLKQADLSDADLSGAIFDDRAEWE